MTSTKTAHNFAILQHARDDESYALKRWCQAAESLQRREQKVRTESAELEEAAKTLQRRKKRTNAVNASVQSTKLL